jgi:hypothetical protein
VLVDQAKDWRRLELMRIYVNTVDHQKIPVSTVVEVNLAGNT